MKTVTMLLAAAVTVGLVGAAGAQEFTIRASSFLGADGDSVRGARIQSDGTIVLGANLSGPTAAGKTIANLTAAPDAKGCILRLAPDGREVLSAVRVAPQVVDLATDDKDNIYLAAGPGGVVKAAAAADQVLWAKDLGAPCTRVDAARDGHSAAAVPGKGIWVFDPAGKEIAAAIGRGNTADVCLDSASRTVVTVGFRNARAHDGKRNEPVQISYALGLSYDGKQKWLDYDWSTSRESDRFINKPTNNMADSRGYRCAIGRDGALYCGFETAGGNHIFRYSPTNIMEPVRLVGGDRYHLFYNTGASHKSVLLKFDPATGKLREGQQFCPRDERDRAGNSRLKEGDIQADEEGRLFIAGYADPSLPLTLDPCPAGEPKGGAYLAALAPDLAKRLLCTRMQGRAEQGATSAHAVDARRVAGRLVVVYAGSGARTGMHTASPVQKEAAGSAGFFVILEAVQR
jgi:hypothetical protein